MTVIVATSFLILGPPLSDPGSLLNLLKLEVFLVTFFVLIAYISHNSDTVSNVLVRFLRFLGIIPKPTEAGLFVMALITLLVPTVYGFWPMLIDAFSLAKDPRAYLYAAVFLIGLYLSIHHVFVRRARSSNEEAFIRFFMIIVLFSLAASLGSQALGEEGTGYVILGAWNLIQALVLLFVYRINPKLFALPKKNAERKEMLAALLLVPTMITLLWILKQDWLITASTTLVVWSYFDIFFQSKFMTHR